MLLQLMHGDDGGANSRSSSSEVGERHFHRRGTHQNRATDSPRRPAPTLPVRPRGSLIRSTVLVLVQVSLPAREAILVEREFWLSSHSAIALTSRARPAGEPLWAEEVSDQSLRPAPPPPPGGGSRKGQKRSLRLEPGPGRRRVVHAASGDQERLELVRFRTALS